MCQAPVFGHLAQRAHTDTSYNLQWASVPAQCTDGNHSLTLSRMGPPISSRLPLLSMVGTGADLAHEKPQ